jgi:hypothetical protein
MQAFLYRFVAWDVGEVFHVYVFDGNEIQFNLYDSLSILEYKVTGFHFDYSR